MTDSWTMHFCINLYKGISFDLIFSGFSKLNQLTNRNILVYMLKLTMPKNPFFWKRNMFRIVLNGVLLSIINLKRRKRRHNSAYSNVYCFVFLDFLPIFEAK